MKSPFKMLFACLFAKRNLFNLLLLLICIALTVAGAWLVYSGQYQRFYPQVLPVIAATAVAFTLSILMALLMARLPVNNLQTELSDLHNQQRHHKEAVALLADEVNALKQRDLSVNVTVSDTITNGVAETLNSGFVALRQQLRDARESLTELQSAAQETQATAMHLEDATEHQTQQISETSAAARIVVNDMAELANNAQSHPQFSTAINTALTASREAAGSVNSEFDALNNSHHEIQSELATLNARLQSADSQLNEAHELNEQAHILSLNAAIQAAMAGEQGHGVAVIAEQIQQLTQRSDSLLNALSAQFASLTESREIITQNADTGSQHLQTGREQLLTTQQSLTEIETHSAAFSELAHTLEQEITQQQAAVQRLSESISIVDEISQQTITGSQDNRTSLERMNSLTEQLQETLTQVRLS